MAETAPQNDRESTYREAGDQKEIALLAAALHAADSAVLVFEADRGVILFNPAAVDLFGRPPAGPDGLAAWEQACGFHSDESTGRRPRQRIPVGELPWNRAWNGEVLERAVYFLRNNQHRSGAWVQVNATPEARRVVVSARDISSRRRAELALKSARRMTRVLFDESRAPIIRTALDGRILASNKAFARMLGFANPSEAVAFHITEFLTESTFDAAVAELLKKGGIVEQPFEFRKQDGVEGTAMANLQIVEPAPGEAESTVIVTLVDLTLPYLDAQFRAFMKNFPGVAFIKDKSGKFLYSSESLKAQPELSGRFQKPDEDVLDCRQILRVIEDLPVKGGNQQWTVYKFPILDETGKSQWIGGLGVEDTERLKLESRRQEVERMEAVGRLAGGVAHDFNNLLTVISGYGQMLNDALGRRLPREQLQSYVNELMAATRRATDLTDQLLAFGRRQKARMQRIDLTDKVNSTAPLLSGVVGERIELEIVPYLEPCFVRADPGQIEQVLKNLAANARDAMPNGGRLRIQTLLTNQPPEGLEAGRFVVLRVSDTGVGMDEATRLRIFEPFFTSKPRGKGTGLGLSTVYGIVKQTGGEVVVESEPGAGSVFQIYFPESLSEGEQTAGVNPTVPVPGKTTASGRETVLVVEDDEDVRVLVKAMLERHGFKTLTAENGKDAIRVFQERGAEVQLLLTDVIMPHMNGCELAMRLQRVVPGLKILYMSGYTPDEVALKGVTGRLNLLRKPFDPETLAQRVREVLNQKAAR